MEDLRPWISRTLVAYVLVAAVLAAAGWRFLGAEGGQPAASTGAVAEVAPAPPAQRLTVHVAGAVVRPGVYRLAPGARVQDAVRKAGGPSAGALTDLINLAAPLQDGQQVVIPVPGEPGATDSGPLSLSRASADQLEDLDGIGPALAARIVEWRQRSGGFASVEQLAEVSGIGPARVEALRAQVVP